MNSLRLKEEVKIELEEMSILVNDLLCIFNKSEFIENGYC